MLDCVLFGPGLVGREVLRQLHGYATAVPTSLQRRASGISRGGSPALGSSSPPRKGQGHAQAASSRFPGVRVVAIANSRQMLVVDEQDGEACVPMDRWHKYFPTTATTTDTTAADSKGLRIVPLDVEAITTLLLARQRASASTPLIIDCTASDHIASKYVQWLRAGIHVVTPNKRAFSGELGYWRDIVKATAKVPAVPYALCYHEATVGAGLPVISTLKDLLATGDRVVKIEGVFSGTLSFLFNTFSTPPTASASATADDPNTPPTARRSFSSIVHEAKAAGYTEPDPRDDLNGMDVARKVVILSRVAGLDLALETLPVENVVPEALRGCRTAEEFMRRLDECDGWFERMNEEAGARGEVLRYVGVVSDRGDVPSEVALRSYPYDHPFAQLKGSDNIIAFYTERYPRPLIIQGSGAGAAVTAHGVVSDVLKIAEIVSYGK